MLMRLILVVTITAATTPAGAADRVAFHAMAKLHGTVPMSNQELSHVEGSKILFGSVNQPLYYNSISAYLNEVLLTLLGVGGRTPLTTSTSLRTFVTALPTGGIAVLIEPDTHILVKNFYCVGCTQP
jgi:hypothetical protein